MSGTEPATGDASAVTTTWHWIVCFAVPFATILEAALPHSFGTFVAFFQRSTATPLIELIYITAVTSAAPLALLPVFVPVIRRFNRYHRQVGFGSFVCIALSCFLSSAVPSVHWMFLTYTTIYGVGSSLLLAVCIVILSEYFPVDHPHHILATSLYQIGYPVAAAAFSPLVAHLISKFSWQRALQIIGGIQLVVGCATTLLFKPKHQAQAIADDSKSDDSQQEQTKVSSDEGENLTERRKRYKVVCCSKKDCTSRPQMVPWFLAKYFNYTCWFAMRTTLTPFLRWRGNSLTNSAFIMTSYACGEIALCVTGALLSRYLRGKLLLLHFIGSSGMALFLFLWALLPLSYGLELFIAVFIGLFVQITLSFGYPASAELLGLEMGKAWTITNIFAGLGVFSSPLLGGLSFDNTSSFLVFFYISASLWMVQAILHAVTWAIIRFNRPSSLYEEIG